MTRGRLARGMSHGIGGKRGKIGVKVKEGRRREEKGWVGGRRGDGKLMVRKRGREMRKGKI